MKQLSFFLFAFLLFAACGETTEATDTEATEEMAEEEPMAEETEVTPNIVGLASETATLSTLVTAVTQAGLVETLQGDGPFTVFAPTDEAFAALPEGTLENLLKEENKQQLVDILTFHVVPNKVMSGDLSDGMTAATVNGAELTIAITDGNVMINDANVVSADVAASNGVVHVIDKVLLPASN